MLEYADTLHEPTPSSQKKTPNAPKTQKNPPKKQEQQKKIVNTVRENNTRQKEIKDYL